MMPKAISGRAHQIYLPPPHANHGQLYYFDDVGLRNTPPLEPKKVGLWLSLSPPPVIGSSDYTPNSSPDPIDHLKPRLEIQIALALAHREPSQAGAAGLRRR
ncbi:hypothetical protein OIDMADRAFT_30132 [Oidiodendron maius Zn]|uniref:Uncharacterized protein n=1 Tax=Oidiodendron maius (strain Zn) TaxID=913774 RepID=A0A0C3H8Y9_OIDMZ|nr:hypothetical protein OIDMADRAFT_30132 [Oidiodendron maius Zn]